MGSVTKKKGVGKMSWLEDNFNKRELTAIRKCEKLRRQRQRKK